jgi:hypothetical protein
VASGAAQLRVSAQEVGVASGAAQLRVSAQEVGGASRAWVDEDSGVATLARAVAAPLAATAPTAPVRRGAAAIAAMASSARVAVLEAAAPTPSPDAEVDLTEPVLLELRMALRGKPLDDVAKSLGHEVAAVMRTVSTLMERGAVVRRGTRYFVA